MAGHLDYLGLCSWHWEKLCCVKYRLHYEAPVSLYMHVSRFRLPYYCFNEEFCIIIQFTLQHAWGTTTPVKAAPVGEDALNYPRLESSSVRACVIIVIHIIYILCSFISIQKSLNLTLSEVPRHTPHTSRQPQAITKAQARWVVTWCQLMIIMMIIVILSYQA